MHINCKNTKCGKGVINIVDKSIARSVAKRFVLEGSVPERSDHPRVWAARMVNFT